MYDENGVFLVHSADGALSRSLELYNAGKTRLVYEIPGTVSMEYPWGLLLIVATDDVSTHNIVHKSGIPRKGEVLTALTIYGFEEILADIPNHLVSWGEDIYDHLPGDVQDVTDLHKRAIVVECLHMMPVEDVRRSYLCGSLWKSSQRGADPYGLNLRRGLQLMHRFDSVISTPTLKSDRDEPLKPQVRDMFPGVFHLGSKVWHRSSDFLTERGLALVDGKMEMGMRRTRSGEMEMVLADEPPITPDAMRIATTEDVLNATERGVEPHWYGKQNIRAWVEQKWGDGERKALEIPPKQAKRFGRKEYEEVFYHITGSELAEWQREQDF